MGLASLGTERPFVPLAAGLARHGERPAIVAGEATLSYAELAGRVEAVADALGGDRKLVLVEARSDVGTVVAYLAALAAGHPVLLTDAGRPENVQRLVAAYDPDAVAGTVGGDGEVHVAVRRTTSVHELHPELALLLSTSGSTGSAKLVRLSHTNVQSNAEAIARYLGIVADDRAALALPMHYCYGLSVLNSHLQQGASVIVSGLSVVDRCFWDGFRRHDATSIAGVPYTFDLLDRIGFEEMHLPTLRSVTQAGGRLDPARVRHYAELGRRRGWRFFVMYGQTEATARMAYLPPELAAEHPQAVGVPIPGGRFRLDPLDGVGGHAEPTGDGDESVGELVYSGPNVMLGYAGGPADLALGRVVGELRTGDVARRNAAGLYEIVGRRSRFVKLLGLRIDLDEVEGLLAAQGVAALCAGDDRRLVVAIATGADRAPIDGIRRRLGLPASAVAVHQLDELPRLATGKPDYIAVARLPTEASTATEADDGALTGAVRQLFAELFPGAVLHGDATFVDLGGDSLSYVETSIRLEQLLGHLPAGWHTMPIRRLESLPRSRRRRIVTRVETSVVIRAAAIFLVVGSHAGLLLARGGAHVLLAVAGFNFARFQLSPGRANRPTRAVLRSAARVAVPSMAWIGLVMATTGSLQPTNLLLLNNYLGPRPGTGLWRFWYIEALVQLVLLVAVLLAVPAVRRIERERGFTTALVLLGIGLALHLDVVAIADGTYPHFMPHNVVWLFALGWAGARASHPAQRALLSAVALAVIPGFFAHADRRVVVCVGLLLLLWVPTVPLVRPLNRLVGAVAGASLTIYLTHAVVYRPLLAHGQPAAVAVAGAVTAGVALWLVGQRARRAAASWAPMKGVSRRRPSVGGRGGRPIPARTAPPPPQRSATAMEPPAPVPVSGRSAPPPPAPRRP